MPRRTKLSNCYLPLPLPSSSNTEATEKSNETTSSVRYDGRSAGYELRRLCLETSVISRALGSSLVELGHTKVLAEVHIAAASTSTSSNNSNKIARYGNLTNEASNDIGCLKFHVKYIPFIGIDQILQQEQTISPLDGTATTVTNNNTGNGGAGATQHTVTIGKLNQELISRESELSRQLTAALLPVIILDRYPKCAVVVSVMVLQDDGCCLSTAITAASMALVDAKIEIRDVVTSCTVAVVDSNSSSSSSSSSRNSDSNKDEEDRWVYLADPTEREMTTESESSVAIICLAMTPNHKEVTLWSQSGRLSSGMASQAMELCRDGCRTMHKFMRESWISSAAESTTTN